MKRLSRTAAIAALFASITSFAAAQQVIQGVTEKDGPIYVTTYIEVIPSANGQAIAAMQEYRDAAKKEPGANLIDVLQETGQLHRFVVSEVWASRAAEAAHEKAPAYAAMVAKLKPIALGPLDPRIHQSTHATAPKSPGANTVVVLSHADVAGGNTANLIRAFGPLNEGSQKDAGMVRFEVLDEFPAHVNHFRLQEEWADMAAFEAHNRAAHTQTFRDTIQQWLGTPYDQRIYKVVQ